MAQSRSSQALSVLCCRPARGLPTSADGLACIITPLHHTEYRVQRQSVLLPCNLGCDTIADLFRFTELLHSIPCDRRFWVSLSCRLGVSMADNHSGRHTRCPRLTAQTQRHSGRRLECSRPTATQRASRPCRSVTDHGNTAACAQTSQGRPGRGPPLPRLVPSFSHPCTCMGCTPLHRATAQSTEVQKLNVPRAPPMPTTLSPNHDPARPSLVR